MIAWVARFTIPARLPDEVTLVGVTGHLYPEEVRNYVRRIRKILSDLDISCELVNRPG